MVPELFQHHPSIVLIPVSLAILGAYTALELIGRISYVEKQHQKWWLLGSSISMGLGIWSAHFVKMVGMPSRYEIQWYNSLQIGGSLFLAILVSFLTFLYILSSANKVKKIIVSGLLMGLGILFTHFIDMIVLNSTHYYFVYDVKDFLLSMIIFMILSSCSMYAYHFFQKRPTIYRKILSASALGVVVSAMHYSLMLSTTIYKKSSFPEVETINEYSLLAWITASALLLLLIGMISSFIHQSEGMKSSAVQLIQFRALLDHNPDGILMFDKNGKLVHLNRKAEEIFGFSSEDLIGKNVLNICFPPEDANILREHFECSLKKRMNTETTAKAFHKRGTTVYIKVKNVPIIQNEKVIGVYAMINDMTEKIQINNMLREKENVYRLITENMSDLVSVLDLQGIIHFVSPSHKSLLGYETEEMEGKHYDIFIHPNDLSVIYDRIHKMWEDKDQKPVIVEYRLKTKSGDYIWSESHVTPVYDKNGDFLHYLTVTREISDRKAYEERLKQMAYHDVLTGISNRRYFQEQLVRHIEEAKRKKESFALMYLDCDRFKWVNDTLGHEAGDELLKGFVERVSSCLRKKDIMSRWGGDEFAILLPNIQSKETVQKIAERIVHSLQEPWQIKGNEFLTTSSIGISMFPNDGQTVDELLSNADQALYQAKHNGRNNYQFFTKDIKENIKRIMLLENGLKKALREHAFHLVYQPQVSLSTGELAGVEVLLRYTHPVLGPVSPFEFIPLCEKLHIMDDITEWVLREACKQHKEWKEKGMVVKMAVNVSPLNLSNQRFSEQLKKLFTEEHCDPQYFELELTETSLSSHLEETIRILQELKEAKISIVLDDFGSGYSSLVYFTDFPIDKIKIDKSFVQGIPNKERNSIIIENIARLSKQLGIETLCEGVETEEQAVFLKKYGYEFAQGYFFSKPLSKERFEQKYLATV